MLHKAIAQPTHDANAAAHSDSHPHAALTRLIGGTRASEANPTQILADSNHVPAAHYVGKTLECESYSEWRDQLPDKHDE